MKYYMNRSFYITITSIFIFFFLFSCESNQERQINNRGVDYFDKGQYDLAIADCNKALEINPKCAYAYYNRGIAYYFKKEYDKSWENVKKAQELGYKIQSKFLEDLSKASGRER